MTDEPDPKPEFDPMMQKWMPSWQEAVARVKELEAQLNDCYTCIEQIMENVIEAVALPALFDPTVRKEVVKMSELLDKLRKRND
jgi:hypothetical protein